MLRLINAIVLATVLACIAGCGGGGSSAPSLVAITVQTANVLLPLGSGCQFSATGSYSDNSSADLTSRVTWSSSDTAVATISNSAGSNGAALSVSGGSVTITAALGGVTGTYVLGVVPIGGTVQGTPLTLGNNVSTVAGSAAALSLPVGITTDGRNLYVADSTNNKIRQIVIATGTVTTVAGSGQLGTVDGTGTGARFYHPRGLTTDGTCLYVAELESNKIRKVVISSGAVSTIASVTSPAGITTDGINLFVTDFNSHTINRIAIATGVVTPLAGIAGTPGSATGPVGVATFNHPVGITTDGSHLYVNDSGSGLIRRIVIASGEVSTLANGFTNPATGITTDGTYLYVADYGNTISSIALSGGGVTQLLGTAAGFGHPEGLTSDGKSLFIADSNNNSIRKLD